MITTIICSNLNLHCASVQLFAKPKGFKRKKVTDYHKNDNEQRKRDIPQPVLPFHIHVTRETNINRIQSKAEGPVD